MRHELAIRRRGRSIGRRSFIGRAWGSTSRRACRVGRTGASMRSPSVLPARCGKTSAFKIQPRSVVAHRRWHNGCILCPHLPMNLIKATRVPPTAAQSKKRQLSRRHVSSAELPTYLEGTQFLDEDRAQLRRVRDEIERGLRTNRATPGFLSPNKKATTAVSTYRERLPRRVRPVGDALRDVHRAI